MRWTYLLGFELEEFALEIKEVARSEFIEALKNEGGAIGVA